MHIRSSAAVATGALSMSLLLAGCSSEPTTTFCEDAALLAAEEQANTPESLARIKPIVERMMTKVPDSEDGRIAFVQLEVLFELTALTALDIDLTDPAAAQEQLVALNEIVSRTAGLDPDALDRLLTECGLDDLSSGTTTERIPG